MIKRHFRLTGIANDQVFSCEQKMCPTDLLMKLVLHIRIISKV
jgi:hypothetical protein